MSEGKTPHGTPHCRQKMDHEETECMEGIHLSQDGDKWWALVNT